MGLAAACDPPPLTDAGAPEDAGPPDAAIAPDAGTGGEPAAPAPPAPPADVAPVAPPAPPVASDCGAWAPVTRGAASACAPWGGARLSPTCGAGLAPRWSGCAVVGAPCPTGEWPAELPATGVRYVEAGASGGDGTRARPFGTIADALAGAAPGAVVALSAGRFEETAALPEGVELRGRCASETILAPPSGTAVTASGGATVRDLTIEAPAAIRFAAGTLIATGVRLVGAGTQGIEISGAGRLELSGALIEGAMTSTGAETITVRDGGALVLRDTVVIFDDGVGLRTRDRATAALTDVAILGPRGDVITGSAARISAPGTTLERVALGGRLLVEGAGVADADHLALVDAGIVAATLGATARVRGLVARAGALQASSFARVEASEVLGFDDDGYGVTIAAFEGGSLRLERAHVELASLALSVSDGSLELVDAVLAPPPPESGHPTVSAWASDLVVERVRVGARTYPDAVPVWRLEEGSALRGTDLDLDGADSHTAVHARGATVELARVRVTAACPFGIIAEQGSTVTLEDLSIERLSEDHPIGSFLTDEVVVGAMARTQSAITVRRGRVTDSAGSAFAAADDGTLATLEDVRVERLRGRTDLDGDRGYALLVRGGARIEAARIAVVDARSAAFRAMHGGSTLVLADARVDGVASDALGRGGRALDVGRGSRAEVTRMDATRAGDVAILVAGTGATARLEDLRIAEVRGRDADGTLGHGISVAGAARVELARCVIEGARELGVAVFDPFSRVEGTDLVVEGVLPRVCAATSCASAGGGIAIGAYDEGEVTLARFALRDNALVALQLARHGAADLAHGVVSGHPVAVNLQVEGYDLARLTDDVRYVDNALTFDAESLPVPSAAAPLED